MIKTVFGGAAAIALAAAALPASASEPVTLNDSQMDRVAAGAAYVTPAQLGSIGALAWAHSEVTTTPGLTVVIEGNFTARVGLRGSGTSFDHKAIIVRASPLR